MSKHSKYVTCERKSILTHRDPQGLVYKYAGTGVRAKGATGKQPGAPGYREIVDFEKKIGIYVNSVTEEKTETNFGQIFYGKDGVHIVPDSPERAKQHGLKVDEKKDLYSNLLQVQNAFLNEIPANLVTATICMDDAESYIHFYHDDDPSEDDYELDLYILMYTNLDGVRSGPIEKVIRIDEGFPIPKEGYFVYKRHEPGLVLEQSKNYLYPENFREDLKEIFSDNLRPLAMLSGQKALLNRVEENLHGVLLKWDYESIWLHFYYNDKITSNNEKLAKQTAQDLMESFPKHNLNLQLFHSEEIFDHEPDYDNWNFIFVNRG